MRVAVGAVMLMACGRVGFAPIGDGAVNGSGDGSTSTSDGRVAPSTIYASTFPGAGSLYMIDPITLEPSMGVPMCTNVGSPEMGEIAFDASGQLVAFGFTQVSMFRVASDIATCTAVPMTYQGVQITSPVKGADLVPAGGVGPDWVVVVVTEDQRLFEVNTTDGTTQLLATLAAAPSGDIVWTGSELLMTNDPGSGDDRLLRINMSSGAVTMVGTTGFGSVFGLSWLEGTLYAATAGGDVAIINPATGATGTSINTGIGWGGTATR